jgi:crotonyl-CoA reductase
MTNGTEISKALYKEMRRYVDDAPQIVVDCIGKKTFDASVQIARPGGVVVTCGSSSGALQTYDNRYLWMRLKRIVGVQGANAREAAETNRLVRLGKIVPVLSRVFTLEETGEAARHVQTNQHVGKVGVLCLAEKEGLGIEAPDERAKIGEERLALFRDAA